MTDKQCDKIVNAIMSLTMFMAIIGACIAVILSMGK